MIRSFAVGCLVGVAACCRAAPLSKAPEPPKDIVTRCRGAASDPYDLSDVICVDARTATVTLLRSVTETGASTENASQIVLRPNRMILVRVIQSPQYPVRSVVLTGSGGQTLAEVAGGSAVESKGVAMETAAADCADEPHDRESIYCARFVPRVPGAVRLRIERQPKLEKPEKPEEQRSPVVITSVFPVISVGVAAPAPTPAPSSEKFDFEYLVPRLYSSAIRLGVSAIVGGNDEVYVVRDGAVTQRATPRFTHEVVIGFAPFVRPWNQEGGRHYAYRQSIGSAARLAPYLGLGVVAASTSATGSTEPAYLRSLYLGVEYELFPGASIAANLVLRRVNRLAGDLEVGEPAVMGDTLTEMRVRAGFGIVVNFTPDFLKLAGTVGAK